MDRVKIGIPKALTYYYYDKFWKYFFDNLDVDIIVSPDTNMDILDIGNSVAPDEMCLSLKTYLGHIDYLKDKCDYILIPRIDNYGVSNQTCTNFLGLYDLVNNLFDVNILDYNIVEGDELKGLTNIGNKLGIDEETIKVIYSVALSKAKKESKKLQEIQKQKLNNRKTKKVLLISHPYNTYDSMIGKPIVDMLKKYNIDVIYSDLFDQDVTNKKGLDLSSNLYWKYSKEAIGSILLSDSVDGIIFFSAFPCGLDSLVNELMMRKVDKPYLNIIIDDISSLTGIETRIESFVDIIRED